jgi:uncharacterized C2H2 Zn-finger protein
MGSLPARYSFVLNPYVRERFTKCPKCETPTRVRKLPLVIHVNHSDGPRLVLLNKTCRLCLRCEMLIVHQGELEHVVAAAGLGAGREYVVLGTIDRRTWRRGFIGEAQLADVRQHMADFKKYLKVDVTPAHWEPSTGNAG